ncbi:MAG TPA: hypothetical protein VFN50_03160 [Acidimicrobiales bacterium]|nr:hypothetical protein [Acidimicrobiales bacterium]
MTPEPETTRVELSIPASVEWLALARTTGAAIASRWAFTYDEIADLRLAIDELCLTLVEGPPAARLDLLYALEGDALTVEGRAVGAGEATGIAAPEGGEAVLSSDLSGRILDALVDAHGAENHDGSRRAWLRKQRSTQDA